MSDVTAYLGKDVLSESLSAKARNIGKSLGVEAAADEGMRQIRAKGCADKYEHAALISLAVDKTARRLAASRIERF
jgi:hypothetical protein